VSVSGHLLAFRLLHICLYRVPDRLQLCSHVVFISIKITLAMNMNGPITSGIEDAAADRKRAKADEKGASADGIHL